MNTQVFIEFWFQTKLLRAKATGVHIARKVMTSQMGVQVRFPRKIFLAKIAGKGLFPGMTASMSN